MNKIIGNSDIVAIQELIKTVPSAEVTRKQSEDGYRKKKEKAMNELKTEIAKQIKYATEHGWRVATIDVRERYIDELEFETLKKGFQNRGYEAEEAYCCHDRQLRIKW